MIFGGYGKKKSNSNENHLGEKISSNLKTDSNGFYRDGIAQFSVNDKKKIVAIKFDFKKSYGDPVRQGTAMNSYKRYIADDLTYVSGDTFHSKKRNQNYTITEVTGPDKKVSTATAFLDRK